MKLDRYAPRADNVAKAFESCGLAAKYIRKWFSLDRYLRGLVDPEVIEFLQERVSALGIGAKHYTDFIPLADEVYTKTIYPHIKNYL
jgi:intergrase/recombinase